MKKQLILLFFLSICFVTYSQFEYYKPDTNKTSHRFGDFSVTAAPNVLFSTPNGTQFAGGIKLQLFISKRFSLDADLVFSHDYYHFGPGLIGLPIGLFAWGSMDNDEGISIVDEENSLSTFLFSLAAIALSFEHISYHIPVKNKLDISPYVSLLRYKGAYKHDIYSDPDYIDEQLSFASGIQINKYFGRFILAPYAEYNIGYKDHNSGFNIGGYCGINFPVK